MADKRKNLLLPRELLPQTQKHGIDTSITGMRVHELAIQNYLYKHFVVAEGYPVPVVFASPMDAYAAANTLWQAKEEENNPFQYLRALKDENGKAAYPYPDNIRYPIISVKRMGWTPDIQRSWGIHKWRKAWYPSIVGELQEKETIIESSGTIVQHDLAHVAQVRMPTGWNYKFQIDHFCKYPETQAWFVDSVMRSFPFAGGSMQTWIPVMYPTFYGAELRAIRLYLEGNIETPSLFEPEDGQVEFRTSFNIVLEGYSPDRDVELHPVLWTIASSICPLCPGELKELFDGPCVEEEADLREPMANRVFNEKQDLPKTIK